MVKRYVVIDTDDDNPSDMDLGLGPVYEESEVTGLDDSYLSSSEADAMMVSHKAVAAWTAATTDQKTEALQEATRLIDSLPLRGERYEEKYIENGVQKDINGDGLAQTLEFPRIIDGVTVDYDYGTDLPIVPQRVKDACCWMALSLVDTDSDISEKALQEAGVQAFSRGKLSVTFVKGAATRYFGLPIKAYDLLKRYIEQNPAVV